MSAGMSRRAARCARQDVGDARQARYQPGETAKLFVKAPFAGEGELAIAADKVISLRSFTLPEGGTTLEIPVDANWGSGVYALVTAYRPPAPPAAGSSGGMSARGPGRAVGVAWLGVDPAPRSLAVTLSAPDVVRPRGAGRGADQGRRPGARRGSLRDPRRGRRGGAEADRIRQPRRPANISTASASSGSNCATSTGG